MRVLAAILLLTATLPWGGASGSDAMSEVDARLQRYTGDGPGAALLVLRAGRPVVRRGVGLADLDNGGAARRAGSGHPARRLRRPLPRACALAPRR